MAPLIRNCSVLMILALASAMAQKPPESKSPEPVPIPQMSPEELPAKAPRVSYHDGQLLIEADNASLADVLGAISRETGAQVDNAASFDSERVVAHLAGPPHRVIAELLDGGKFDYIILSPLDDPAGVQKLIVTRQTAAGESRPAAMPAVSRRTAAQAEPGSTPEYRSDADRDPDATVAAPVTPASQSQQPEAQKSGAVSEESARALFSGSDAQKSADPAQNPGPAMLQQGKPPMQVLQDLYRIRQQQQQLNQSQQQQQKPPQE